MTSPQDLETTILASYFYSSDVARIWRIAGAIESGIVGINEGAISSEAAPFGGIKESGYGREESCHGQDDYVGIKYLCEGAPSRGSRNHDITKSKELTTDDSPTMCRCLRRKSSFLSFISPTF